jgi:hypothetical protein
MLMCYVAYKQQPELLGLLLGPPAGLYGMSRKVLWRFVARRSAVISRGRHIARASHYFTQQLVAAWRTPSSPCNGIRDYEISGRRSHGGAEARHKQREEATTGHKGNACVLNTRGCPQVFYTAPVIHPVRVHKHPWQAS